MGSGLDEPLTLHYSVGWGVLGRFPAWLTLPLCSRRVCAVAAPQDPKPESFMQRVYQPYLTTCGHRVCSTYRLVDSACVELGVGGT